MTTSTTTTWPADLLRVGDLTCVSLRGADFELVGHDGIGDVARTLSSYASALVAHNVAHEART
jgi:hypothetical protein